MTVPAELLARRSQRKAAGKPTTRVLA
jgi:hypothetical protein